jgi:hypothetical protein
MSFGSMRKLRVRGVIVPGFRIVFACNTRRVMSQHRLPAP